MARLVKSGDPALVAWLEDVSCDPHVKALVVTAVHASERASTLPGGGASCSPSTPGASALLAEAEQCIRSSGVWRWPGQA